VIRLGIGHGIRRAIGMIFVHSLALAIILMIAVGRSPAFSWCR